MSFNNTILPDFDELSAGHALDSKPGNIEAYDNFEDGLIPGRFVKWDTARVDNIDGSATPVIIGIARKKVASAVEYDNYRTQAALSNGPGFDTVAEVIDFGHATVEVPEGVTPTKFAQVYAVNAAGSGVNFGKATTVSTNNAAVPNCVFIEAKAPNVWLVRMARYLTGAA